MSEVLLDGTFGDCNEGQRKAIALIERCGKHLLELITDILDLAKIESGKLELELSLTSVQNLCSYSLSFIQEIAHKKQIQLTMQVPPNLDLIEVDERRMRQVLINLLTNAIKFTPSGGLVTIDVNVDRSQQKILFAVSDTGIGIAPEDIPKLFQVFVQIDSKLNRQQEGTGLGLALVKRIVELHQGNIELVSTVGQGSQFTLILPYPISSTSQDSRDSIRSCDRAETIASSVGAAGENLPIQPLILLAEDNEANIDTFSGYLTGCGFRMMIARNGEEAIATAHNQIPDLILMDIQMPTMNGLEAIQQLRSDSRFDKVPIIALTALAMASDRERCIEAGANEYIAKPVMMKQLLATIRQLLAV
ncbi:ATP-binding protein [Tumidithrix elongata RA019]|uniref:histidine kinase n=1 Tax=Tumidithrix elongata BACA0141 TaxID=2716417 RepID=A0AAW9PYU6_9CYAN|nr:ATP-binding protein [Tumidithrix elongata RA019]